MKLPALGGPGSWALPADISLAPNIRCPPSSAEPVQERIEDGGRQASPATLDARSAARGREHAQSMTVGIAGDEGRDEAHGRRRLEDGKSTPLPLVVRRLDRHGVRDGQGLSLASD